MHSYSNYYINRLGLAGLVAWRAAHLALGPERRGRLEWFTAVLARVQLTRALGAYLLDRSLQATYIMVISYVYLVVSKWTLRCSSAYMQSVLIM